MSRAEAGLGAVVVLALGRQTWSAQVDDVTCLNQAGALAELLGRDVEIDLFADNGAKWRGRGQR